MVVGAGSAGAALLGGCDDAAAEKETAGFGAGDAGVLNFLLTLEYVMVDLYAAVERSQLFEESERRTLHQFGTQEGQHAVALQRAVESLEATPAKEPETGFRLDGRPQALEVVARLEATTAAAYLGQVPHVEGRAALSTLLSIHSVEGRHAAALSLMQGKSFSPDGPFAEPVSARQALKSLDPFLVGAG